MMNRMGSPPVLWVAILARRRSRGHGCRPISSGAEKMDRASPTLSPDGL